MAKNRALTPKTLQDIDNRVERVLRGLGNPEPPLRLEDVRELLKLDLAFYSAQDPGITREVISKIRVATIQIYERPTLLIDAICKLSLKALYLPDRKRILIDRDLPQKKHRWNEGHEIGHHVASVVNPALAEMGILEKLERTGSKGEIKTFWSLTEEGLEYGRNETSPNNPRQTTPLFYVNRFEGLLRKLEA
ncbi:MAG: hypothetical protein EOM12_15720, partial [Verrucomicrobiae bacterium]|nr:hypothetical protein [Verrucomicrobiae bacterium]